MPGGTITYSVWIWSTVPSHRVTASVAVDGQSVRMPRFGLCPAANGSTCRVGTLPAYQAFELLITDHVEKIALPGEQVALTVTVSGNAQAPASAPLSPAEASVSTVLGTPPATPTPIDTGTLGGVPPTTIPGLPGTTVPPGSITSLFPVVTPSATPSPASSRQGRRKVVKATSTASSLPLDPRLIGGQLAGLAVLAAAITMVMARLSLRTPALAQPSGPSAPPEPVPAPPAEAAAEAQTPAEAPKTKTPEETEPPATT